MGTYNEWILGYVIESTWGTSAIGASNVTAYKFGHIGDVEECLMPDPIADLIYSPTAVNALEVIAGEVYKSTYVSDGFLPMGAQNGVPIGLVMGKSSTVDDSPGAGINTHTLVVQTAVAGILPLNPSFTIQYEKKGTATDWATQYRGTKIGKLTMEISRETGYLSYFVDIISKQPADPGFVLDTAPALPVTSNTALFAFGNTTFTYDTVDISAYITGMQFEIFPDIRQIYENAEEYPAQFVEAFRKKYELRLSLTPYADDMWDELIAAANTKDMTIKLTRHSTDDYISLALSDLMFKKVPQKVPPRNTAEVVEVIADPRSVTVTVVDKLEGSDYGE